ncbi:hypothetical protein [Achromobacter xylosoxidans]|uniref:hypothetical protein n=1 Tax=Alcaligenes xylosoxydans xylosoxydans TaxID=85698 RepID=UPI0012A80B88|nr:hypothetical protein [Achromobacter xylosoxidans]CUR81887.1 hypothetical protein BN2910_52160 [Achromobacter xylosoxidans]
MSSALIIEQYEGQPVHFMGDGWFNATGPAKRHGKEPYEWLRLPDTEAYLAALGRRYASNAQEMSKPGKSRFVLTRRGVRPWPFWPTSQHIPGDTRTPPAPGAVRIGPEDV